MRNPIQWLYNKVIPEPPPTPPGSRAEAFDARRRAERSLTVARERAHSVEPLVASLREQNERNSFAELIELTMRGNG